MTSVQDRKVAKAVRLATHYAGTTQDAVAEVLGSRTPSSGSGGAGLVDRLPRGNAAGHGLWSRVNALYMGMVHVGTHYGHSVSDMETTLETFHGLMATLKSELASVLADLEATPVDPSLGLEEATLVDFVDGDSVDRVIAELDASFAHLQKIHAFAAQNLRVVQSRWVDGVRSVEAGWAAWAKYWDEQAVHEIPDWVAQLSSAAAVVSDGAAVPDSELSSSHVLKMYEANTKVVALRDKIAAVADAQNKMLQSGADAASAVVEAEAEIASKVVLLDNLEYQFSDGLQGVIAVYSELHHLTAWYVGFRDSYTLLVDEQARRAAVEAELARAWATELDTRAAWDAQWGRFLPDGMLHWLTTPTTATAVAASTTASNAPESNAPESNAPESNAPDLAKPTA